MNTLLKNNNCKLFILLAIPLILLVSLPPLNGHALGKHGNEAKQAWDWVSRNGDFCEYRYDDGRIRYVCEMPDGFFAVVVLVVITTWAGVVCHKQKKLVTAFKADPSTAHYIRSQGRSTYSYHQKDGHS